MPAKKIRYKGATYVLAKPYHDKAVTVEVHIDCAEGAPTSSNDCTYTARIVGASLDIKELEAWGVERETKAKSGIEALRKMALNWERSGFLQ